MTKKEFYNILVEETGYEDSYEDFDSMTSTPEGRKEFYDILVENTGYEDDYEWFESVVRGESNTQPTPKPISAVQSPQGGFYDKESVIEYANSNSTSNLQATAQANQELASGEVTATPTAPSAPKAEDISITKPTAMTNNVSVRPVSAIQKGDGTPYNAEELQGIASQQQAESTTQVADPTSAEIEAKINEKIANQGYLTKAAVEADEAKLAEAKAKESEGENVEGEDSWGSYKSRLKELYPQGDEPTDKAPAPQGIGVQLPIEAPMNRYAVGYEEFAESQVVQAIYRDAIEKNGGKPLTEAQKIELSGKMKRMSAEEVRTILGDEGMEELRKAKEEAIEWEKKDQRNAVAINALLEHPEMVEYLSQYTANKSAEGVAELASNAMLGSDVELGQMDMAQAAEYVAAKMSGIGYLFGQEGMDYYMEHLGTKDLKSQAMLNSAMTYTELFGGEIKLPQEAEKYVKNTFGDIMRRGQLGSDDGDARIGEALQKIETYGNVMSMMSEEDKAIVIERTNNGLAEGLKINTLADACFDRYDSTWDMVVQNAMTLKQQQGLIQGLDANLEEVKRRKEEISDWSDTAIDIATKTALGPVDILFGDVASDALRTVTNPGMAMLNYAEEYYNDANDLLNYGKESGMSGFFYGLGDALLDSRTWDFGARDMQMAIMLKYVSDKWESGEELTQEETMFMDAVATNTAAQALTKATTAYNVGSGVGYSIPYLIEMALPIKGGKTLASRLYKWALSRTEQGALKNIAKGTSKILGGLTEGVLRASTIGSMRVTSGAIERMTPKIKAKVNDGGEIEFDGFEAKPDMGYGQAFGEAAWEQVANYWIERAGGDIFKILGKPKGWALDWLKKKGIEIPKNATWTDITKRMAWDGMLPEFGEEILAQIITAPVTEQTLDTNEQTGVFSKENLTTTLLTTAVLGTVLNVPNMASYRSEQTRLQKQCDVLSSSLELEMGERWESYQSMIDGATMTEMSQVMRDIANDGELSSGQKEMMLRYAVNKNAYREMMSRFEGEAMASEHTPVIETQRRIETSARMGARISTAEEGFVSKMDEQASALVLADMLGVNSISEAQGLLMQHYGTNDATEIAMAVSQDESLTESQKEGIISHLESVAKNRAKIESIETKAKVKKEAELRQLDAISNKDMNKTVIGAMTKGSDKPVYVIAGMVTPDEGGDIVGHLSDKEVVIIDSEGNREMVDPTTLYGIKMTSWNDAVASVETRINEEAGQEWKAKNGILSQGDETTIKYTETNGEPSLTNITVDAVRYENGTEMIYFHVTGGDGTQHAMPEWDMNDLRQDAYNDTWEWGNPEPVSDAWRGEGREAMASEAASAQVIEQAPSTQVTEVAEKSTEQPMEIAPGVAVRVGGVAGVATSFPEDGKVIVETEDGKILPYDESEVEVVGETTETTGTTETTMSDESNESNNALKIDEIKKAGPLEIAEKTAGGIKNTSDPSKSTELTPLQARLVRTRVRRILEQRGTREQMHDALSSVTHHISTNFPALKIIYYVQDAVNAGVMSVDEAMEYVEAFMYVQDDIHKEWLERQVNDAAKDSVDKVSEVTNDAKESQSTASPLGAIPVDAKGEPMYESAPVEATIADIYNDPDLDEDEADAFVQAKIDGATKRIAQLEKKKPKMGESKVAFKEAKAKWREQLEAEQASLAYWQGVQEAVPEMRRKERAKRQMEADIAQREREQQERAEQSRRAEERGRNRGDYRKAIAGWEDTPSSFHEYVAQALLVGNHKMRWNDNGSTRGLGSHTTGRRDVNRRGEVVTARNDESRAMGWLIDDRGGLSPEALADKLWNEYTGSYGEEMSEGSPLDVLLDVVTSMPTPQMMWDYVKGEHDARMEAEQGTYEEQYSAEEIEAFERDAMYREKYGVSEEEYWANEAQWDEFIESREMSAEELGNYDNFVAEERIKEEHGRRNQENAEDEQRTDNSESEGGVEVLSGTQPDITRGNEDVAGESEGVDGNGVESNDVASEEAAELSEEDRQAIENMPIPTLKRQIKDTATTLFNVSQTSDQWQAENKDKIERAKLLLAYAKQELARKERLKKSNKWGIKIGNSATPFDVVRKMFEEFNSNEDIAQLFEKVAKVFESLPIKIVFSDTIGGKSTQGWFSPTTGTLKLPGYFVYGGGISEQNKAETILHEMIHAVTTYALYINEKPYLQTELGFRLSDDMHAAIRQLKRIYASIASDKDFKGEYGAVSVHEMIAELSNVQFREKLKKKGLWETIVDAIKQLFGITPSNALEGAEAALEYMLNNFDRSQWDKMAGMGEKRGKQMRIGVDKMGSSFEYFTGSLTDLISIAKKAVKGLFKKNITPASSRLVGDLKELGIDISEEYKHVVDNYAIRHTFNNHGGKGESLRGQIPINNSDFELIPDIVNNYDNITTIVTRKGLPGILYEKTFEDGTTVYVEEIHNKHKELTLVSMRKIKRPTLLGANRTNEPTPIPSSGKSSANKGSDNIGDVQGLEDYSAEEIKEIAREYIEEVIAENGFDADVVDLAIYGSRRRGDAREDSDLDIVVEYSGNAREDDLFNALNDAETQLEMNGVKVDINPITKGKSGSLNEFIKRAREYDEGNESNGSTKESQPLSRGATAPLSEQEGSLEDDGLLFRDGEVFYSNAEEAVRNIKQEKATPEQWLAMIQKNGGLKAGEDKWLGLSDWLNEKGKRKDERGKSVTLTKEEVLEFINQNKIAIEEVGYGGASIASAQSEFDELTEELGGYDEAFEEMVNRYGDDFREAVWYDEVGQLHLEDGYEDYGEILGIERGINRTRLDYTTEGLENKKEIALVVPSIDPYNAHDEIHFGDAGGGRAVAWVRFGETRVPRQVEVKRSADELEDPYKNVNGRDVWRVKGRENDYIAHSKLKNGMERYLIYVNDKLIGTTLEDTFDTLEEAQAAMNRYYAEHPVYKTVYDNVLVIDEIQSKRHQDGREKGYRDADVPNRVEDAKKAVAEAEREFADFRNAMQEKYDYDSLVQGSAEERKEGRKAWRGKFTPEEMIKYDQLHDATIDARNALEEARQSQNLVPDAPFEKNWQELAMKRMLRYAAENGFDKVAWTTGAQQAERYSMGRLFNDIEREDNPNLEGRRFVLSGANAETFQVDDNGNITASTISEAEGKSLQEVVGKEMAIKMMNLEDGDLIENEDLRIGGEGMKGFYDKMLPSFMNKYGKKWGVKVGEVTMPNIGDSGLTMHSVDVTDAMKESVMEGQPMFRDGSGALSDAEVSYANDPFAKALGKSQRSKAKQAKFAERERKYMRNRVAELAEKMHLDNVEVVDNSQSTPSPLRGTPPKQGSGGELNASNGGVMSERKGRAKGWFDTRTGKIVINISNHLSVADVERTLLHEAVAHYGLRQLFGKQFDTFLDNVYLHADAEVRAQIIELAKKHGWDFRTATEEYLAGLAEDTNFEYLEYQTSFWMKIKRLFMDMLESIGWNYQGPELSDNELRYLLWRSYENMVNPGRHRSILGKAEDVAKQYALGVGNYSADAETMSHVAESGAVMVDNQGNPIDEDGKLIVEQVSSIDEITDADFDSPTRSIQLPSIPPKVDEAIGANGKPIVIKKNVFEKNKKSHKDLTPKDSRAILINTLYSPDLYGQNQKITRPYNWILIHLADTNTAVLVEVNENKDNVEIVNWHYINDDAIERKKKQAIREGGLILTLESAAADTSNFLPSADKGTINLRNTNELGEKIAEAESEVNTNPTDKQKEAGNYKKGHVKVGPFNITIEQPKGSVRRGVDADGNKWETEMQNTYGYIRGTEGVDGDHIDVFLSDDIDGWDGHKVFVVDQRNADGSFDEHKVMLGFNDINDAEAAYKSNYEEGWQGLGAITGVAIEEFGKWIASSHRKTKAFAEYKSVKTTEGQSTDEGILFRDGESDGTREEYNRRVRRPNRSGSVGKWDNLGWRMKEAYQDSMLSLKELQDVIAKKYGLKEIPSWMNAYLQENLMSSRNKAASDVYMRDFYNPMMKEVQALIKKGVKYEDLVNYMIAKHGLERNVVMAERDAKRAADEAKKKGEDWQKAYDEALKENRERDYSGLTALTGEESVMTAEKVAEKMVEEFEGAHETDALWEKVNAATKETLRKSYEGGLMSKETYESTDAMYEHYIPLRGWDSDIASDVYEYLMSDRPLLSPALKTAKGRTSLADDPIATIGMMADSTIAQANRNKMKQAFYYFAVNNPSDVVTISKQWYVYDEVTKKWQPRSADIPLDASSEEIATIVEEFEARMEELARDGKAKRKSQGLDLDLRTVGREGEEHTVRVKVNGEEYCIYVNGSPRAAQALNGLTNPEMFDDALMKGTKKVNNYLAQVFTSKNPEFVFSNMSRDLMWATGAVAVKENAKYNVAYHKNINKIFWSGTMPRLVHRHMMGTLNMNNELDRYFEEFVRHGGETGYTAINSIEHYKRNIKRSVKDAQGKRGMTKKAWNGVFDAIEFMNRSAENMTRFAVYVTSREMGRDQARAAHDAKEITVNFNKKGSGELGARYLGGLYVFMNACIQSMANFARLTGKHPVKMTGALATMAGLGFMLPLLNRMLAEAMGDDDEYWNLPEWVRRNNLVFRIPGTNKFITLPISHELRPFYGIGEIAYSVMNEKEDAKEGLGKAMLGFSGMSPIDFTGNGGNVAVNLTPTAFQPVAQLIANVDYFGKPIFKDADYLEDYPEYTKAYKGTSPMLVSGTEFLNRVSGGDAVVKGDADLNPDVIEHLVESYFGGAGKTANKAIKGFSMIWDEDTREVRNIPIVSKFLQTAEERTYGSHTQKEFYEAMDKVEDTGHKLSGYGKQATMGSIEYAEKLNELINSPEYKEYKLAMGYKSAIKKLQNSLGNIDKTKEKEVSEAIQRLQKEMLEELPNTKAQDIDTVLDNAEEVKWGAEEKVESIFGSSVDDFYNRKDAVNDAKEYGDTTALKQFIESGRGKDNK